MKRFFSIFVFLFPFAFSQSPIDSLLKVVATSNNDSVIYNALLNLGSLYLYSIPDTAIYYYTQAENVAEKIGGIKGDFMKAEALRRKGWSYLLQANLESSLALCDSSKNIVQPYIENKDPTISRNAKKIYTNCITHIGSIYELQGNYSKALDFYFEALKRLDELKEEKDKAQIYGNIGNVYYQQGNYSKALEYHFKALALFKKYKDKRGQAITMSNIAPSYHEQKNYKKALQYYSNALEIFKQIESKRGIANNLGNIGSLYYDQGDFKKALEYYFMALKVSREGGFQQSEANNLGNLGSTYLAMKQYSKAEKYLKQAEDLYRELGTLYYLKGILGSLADLYEKRGNYKLALLYHKEYTKVQDSLTSEENRKALQTMEVKYQYEKAKIQREAEFQKQLAIQKKEKEKQETITIAVTGGLLLVLFFSFLLYHRLQITRKQKRTIEHQKAELETQKRIIEEKNKDIVESITYAARLQRALLPPREKLSELLPQSFLLYMPKDIVSGDFYYMEGVSNYVFLAVGDCTGHGVPAAMMTMICSSALMRAIKEEKLVNTDEILNRVKEIVKERVSLHEKHLLEGMDISLIRIDKHEKGVIQFSGINHVAVLIRETGVEEFKTDRSPYGLYHPDPFSRIIIHAEEGSMLYLFTDGYPTQFGGQKGKPLMKKRFVKILEQISIFPVDKQEEELETAFFKWKGELDQVDDVCVAGIRI